MGEETSSEKELSGALQRVYQKAYNDLLASTAFKNLVVKEPDPWKGALT